VQIACHPGPLLFLGPQRRARGAPSLRLQAPQHAQVGKLEALDLGRLAPAVDGAGDLGPGAAEVDLLHVLDQPLERSEAGSQKHQVGEQAERRRDPDHQQHACGLADLQPGEQCGGQRRGADQCHVDGHHLAEQGSPSHSCEA
jgi:hypothetical protein